VITVLNVGLCLVMAIAMIRLIFSVKGFWALWDNSASRRQHI
jgi:hypothetical protein